MILSSTIVFLKLSEETSRQTTFLLAATSTVLVTIACVFLSHLLPLHQNSPNNPIRRRRCRLTNTMENLHDGASCFLLLPATLLFLVPPPSSPYAIVSAVLSGVLMLLIGAQCVENVRKPWRPGTSPSGQREEEEERQDTEQRTSPPQECNAELTPTRRYTINATRGRGTNRRWLKYGQRPPSLALTQSPVSQGSFPAPSSPRTSPHQPSGNLNSNGGVAHSPRSQPIPSLRSCTHRYAFPSSYGTGSSAHATHYSGPLSSVPTPLPNTPVPVLPQVSMPCSISPLLSSQGSPQNEISLSSLSSTSLSNTAGASSSQISLSDLKSPVKPSPRPPLSLSTYSGVSLPSPPSSPRPLPNTALSPPLQRETSFSFPPPLKLPGNAVPLSPKASVLHLHSPLLSSPRSSLHKPPRCYNPCCSPYSRSLEEAVSSVYEETVNSPPLSPASTNSYPSPCNTPTHEPLSLSSATTPSLTNATPAGDNIDLSPPATDIAAPIVTFTPNPKTTTPSPLRSAPSPTLSTPIRPNNLPIVHATQCDASTSTDNEPVPESVSSAVSSSVPTATTMSAGAPMSTPPIYENVPSSTNPDPNEPDSCSSHVTDL